MNHTVKSWTEANAKMASLTAGYRTLHGTGNPLGTPHAVVTTMDAWSGEGVGYCIRIYPEGDTYGAPSLFHRVSLLP